MEQNPATPQPPDPSARPPAPSPQQQQQPHPPPPPSSSSSSSSSSPSASAPVPAPTTPNPNPNSSAIQTPTLKPQQQQQQQPAPQPRPPFNRNWPQHSQLQSLQSSIPSSLPGSPLPASSSISGVSAPAMQRGGVAIGVPAHHPAPTPPGPGSFSSLSGSSIGQHFAGLGRKPVNASEGMGTTAQARQSMQNIQGVGMGTLSSGSQMRPSGMATQHQQRPAQSSFRPPSAANNPSPATQNFQVHGSMRSSSSPTPSTSQNLQSPNQPWLSSGPQGKPPLPSPQYRSITQTMQQRSHIPQHHHHPLGSQQKSMLSSQRPQQTPQLHMPQEQQGQQTPSSRVSQSLPHQQQAVRGSGNQKSSTLATVQPSAAELGPNSKTDDAEISESGGRILGKRSIQELVSQIDPSERLDPEVEDILVDIAEDFIESITTFGCSLAKHRKSNTLEAKDILLHLERNWNMNVPGFGGDEIKTYKKAVVNDVHRERLAVIKKSLMGAETPNTKNSAPQAAGNAKGHAAKASG